MEEFMPSWHSGPLKAYDPEILNNLSGMNRKDRFCASSLSMTSGENSSQMTNDIN